MKWWKVKEFLGRYVLVSILVGLTTLTMVGSVVIAFLRWHGVM